ncbi:hypothetical protein JXM83_02720 [Candidatus Woesearchaeota archaeon]|nr:hypothetical protein [Candidatus Woesearchaeota archaeon]
MILSNFVYISNYYASIVCFLFFLIILFFIIKRLNIEFKKNLIPILFLFLLILFLGLINIDYNVSGETDLYMTSGICLSNNNLFQKYPLCEELVMQNEFMWPTILSLFFRLFGLSIFVSGLVSIIIAGLCCILIYLILIKFTSLFNSFLGSLFIFILPYNLNFMILPIKEGSFIFGVLLLLLYLSRRPKLSSPIDLFFLNVISCFSYLVRAQGIILFPIFYSIYLLSNVKLPIKTKLRDIFISLLPILIIFNTDISLYLNKLPGFPEYSLASIFFGFLNNLKVIHLWNYLIKIFNGFNLFVIVVLIGILANFIKTKRKFNQSLKIGIILYLVFTTLVFFIFFSGTDSIAAIYQANFHHISNMSVIFWLGIILMISHVFDVKIIKYRSLKLSLSLIFITILFISLFLYYPIINENPSSNIFELDLGIRDSSKIIESYETVYFVSNEYNRFNFNQFLYLNDIFLHKFKFIYFIEKKYYYTELSDEESNDFFIVDKYIYNFNDSIFLFRRTDLFWDHNCSLIGLNLSKYLSSYFYNFNNNSKLLINYSDSICTFEVK